MVVRDCKHSSSRGTSLGTLIPGIPSTSTLGRLSWSTTKTCELILNDNHIVLEQTPNIHYMVYTMYTFRSGTVSKEEVMEVCKKMSITVNDADLKEIMSKLVTTE